MSGLLQVDLGVLRQMTKTLRDAGDQADAALNTGRMAAAGMPKGAE